MGTRTRQGSERHAPPALTYVPLRLPGPGGLPRAAPRWPHFDSRLPGASGFRPTVYGSRRRPARAAHRPPPAFPLEAEGRLSDPWLVGFSMPSHVHAAAGLFPKRHTSGQRTTTALPATISPWKALCYHAVVLIIDAGSRKVGHPWQQRISLSRQALVERFPQPIAHWQHFGRKGATAAPPFSWRAVAHSRCGVGLTCPRQRASEFANHHSA
jgi:hypothetical protein